MRKRTTIIAFALCAGMTCSALAAKTPPSKMPPVLVSTAKAQQVPWQQQVSAIGTLSAFQGVTVKPEISGRITKIYFKSGESVQAGAPLIEINPAIIQAKVALYKAELTLSQLNYQRQLKLYKRKAAAKSALDQALAAMQSDQSNLGGAQAELAQTTVLAPFSGKLGLRQINLGEYVAAGQAIVNLEALDPMRVDFSIPQVYLNLAAVGDTVLLRSDAFPNKTFTGKVYAAESLVEVTTRTLAIRARIPNPQSKLLPGTFVNVTLLLGPKQNVIIIPQTAINYSQQANFVYKVVKGKAMMTPVTLGPRTDKTVIIKKGLKAGDVVVTAGQVKLYPGANVMVAPPTQQGKGA